MQSSLEKKVYKHRHKVSYAETDQMGFMHHSNYARVYENARWELFRSLGISYKSIEESGIIMPVIGMDLKYIKPAYYDDIINIDVTISYCSGAKICFSYITTGCSNIVINTANVTLAFVDKNSGNPVRVPKYIYSKLSNTQPVNYHL